MIYFNIPVLGLYKLHSVYAESCEGDIQGNDLNMDLNNSAGETV